MTVGICSVGSAIVDDAVGDVVQAIGGPIGSDDSYVVGVLVVADEQPLVVGGGQLVAAGAEVGAVVVVLVRGTPVAGGVLAYLHVVACGRGGDGALCKQLGHAGWQVCRVVVVAHEHLSLQPQVSVGADGGSGSRGAGVGVGSCAVGQRLRRSKEEPIVVAVIDDVGRLQVGGHGEGCAQVAGHRHAGREHHLAGLVDDAVVVHGRRQQNFGLVVDGAQVVLIGPSAVAVGDHLRCVAGHGLTDEAVAAEQCPGAYDVTLRAVGHQPGVAAAAAQTVLRGQEVAAHVGHGVADGDGIGVLAMEGPEVEVVPFRRVGGVVETQLVGIVRRVEGHAAGAPAQVALCGLRVVVDGVGGHTAQVYIYSVRPEGDAVVSIIFILHVEGLPVFRGEGGSLYGTVLQGVFAVGDGELVQRVELVVLGQWAAVLCGHGHVAALVGTDGGTVEYRAACALVDAHDVQRHADLGNARSQGDG